MTAFEWSTRQRFVSATELHHSDADEDTEIDRTLKFAQLHNRNFLTLSANQAELKISRPIADCAAVDVLS